MICPKCNNKTDCLIKLKTGELVCLDCCRQKEPNTLKNTD